MTSVPSAAEVPFGATLGQGRRGVRARRSAPRGHRHCGTYPVDRAVTCGDGRDEAGRGLPPRSSSRVPAERRRAWCRPPGAAARPWVGQQFDTWRTVLPALGGDPGGRPGPARARRSDKPLQDYSLGAHANSLRDLMVALGIDRATVVGQSLGGGVAMQLAYQYPATASVSFWCPAAARRGGVVDAPRAAPCPASST